MTRIAFIGVGTMGPSIAGAALADYRAAQGAGLGSRDWKDRETPTATSRRAPCPVIST